MLKAIAHKDFEKEFKKLPKNMKAKFRERLLLFLKNPSEPVLRDHSLIGLLQGKRAFSVAGDMRVVYRYLDKNIVLLLRVGAHNQVY